MTSAGRKLLKRAAMGPIEVLSQGEKSAARKLAADGLLKFCGTKIQIHWHYHVYAITDAGRAALAL